MLRLILVLVLISILSCTCVGQQSIGPTSREIADFAFELSIYPADRRAEMMAAHPERLTVALRRELIALGNVRFTASESGNVIIALSWAWFLAGTPAVVLNRRQMNDSDFVNDLHQQFKLEPTPDELRRTVLKLKKEKNPDQWAGYMFLGTP